jgi:hypothetical protein
VPWNLVLPKPDLRSERRVMPNELSTPDLDSNRVFGANLSVVRGESGVSIVLVLAVSVVVSIIALLAANSITSHGKGQNNLHNLSQQALFEQQFTMQMRSLETYRRTLNIVPTPAPSP